jgi:hypothetical protein
MWLFLLRRLRGAIAAAVAPVEPTGMLAAYERQDIPACHTDAARDQMIWV